MKKTKIKKRLFDDLAQGLKEAERYLQSKPNKSRTHRIPVVDVRAVRNKLGLSQSVFAERFGFSTATLRNWEQGRRQPEIPARILFSIIDKHPHVVEDVLR